MLSRHLVLSPFPPSYRDPAFPLPATAHAFRPFTLDPTPNDAALAHGLPMILIPMGADQPLNAARCVALGVARALDPIAATPETVQEAVTAVLADPTYRRAAERMRDEIAALPEPAYAVTLLERLVTNLKR